MNFADSSWINFGLTSVKFKQFKLNRDLLTKRHVIKD